MLGGRRKKPWEQSLCNQSQNQNPAHGKKITVRAAATFLVARKMPIAIAKCVWPASMPPSISCPPASTKAPSPSSLNPTKSTTFSAPLSPSMPLLCPLPDPVRFSSHHPLLYPDQVPDQTPPTKWRSRPWDKKPLLSVSSGCFSFLDYLYLRTLFSPRWSLGFSSLLSRRMWSKGSVRNVAEWVIWMESWGFCTQSWQVWLLGKFQIAVSLISHRGKSARYLWLLKRKLFYSVFVDSRVKSGSHISWIWTSEFKMWRLELIFTE